MTKSRVPVVVLVGCGVAVAGGAGFLWSQASGPKVREAQGFITFVDVTARRASIETTHPKSGAAMEVSGEVPIECTITINDSPATLADLQIGDAAVIRGRAQREPAKDGKKGGRRFTAESIRVTR